MSKNKEVDLELVKKACEHLSEHFDTVQIFTTRHEAGELNGSVNINYGSGNWFARYGHVQHWLVKQDEFTRKECTDNEE